MKKAWEGEYTEYVTARLPSLRRLAHLLCGDPHRADDIVQQSITTLYVRWPKVRTMEHIDRYVRTMVVNNFLDERRGRWSKIQLFAAPPERRAPEGPDIEGRSVLRAALAKVPTRQQAVLTLRFLCDMSVAEVAATLRCSEGTVKSQTARGLEKLRHLLGDHVVTTTGGR